MVVVDTPAGMTREAVERLSTSKDEPDWMLERRLRAFQLFESTPMPTRQDEEWRRTDIGKLKLGSLTPLPPASGSVVDSPLKLNGNSSGLLVHDNASTVERSLRDDLAQQGVIFTDLETAVQHHPELVRKYFMTEAVNADYDTFTALNGAFWSGGTFLYVPKKADIALPLRALYALTAPGAGLFTHTLVVVEEGARVSYLEEYASQGIDRQSLNAGVVELFVGPRAHVTFITLQEWMGEVFDVSTQRALLERDSKLEWLVIGVGNGTTKANIEASLRGVGASAEMLGILWGYGQQHTDYRTLQDHVAPHTTSDLLYKAALSDESTSIFSGRIRVERGAQGTDAYQTNRSLLLSEHASAFPSPNLEIEANEVRCSHGASVGRVDQDQLFYLMARGIPREQATRMIVEGFFTDVLAREPVDAIRDNLADLIARKLDERA
ncbi:MAG TPA: Fe-S cluster assembly protein SufD [Chloroflexota bacterium]|nr:Fe-S cluster assembly protein SufD [Chloroflexota bacterium]